VHTAVDLAAADSPAAVVVSPVAVVDSTADAVN